MRHMTEPRKGTHRHDCERCHGYWECYIRESAVHLWLLKHGIGELAVTNVKDFGMAELWDDRAVRVLTNQGVNCCHFVLFAEKGEPNG